MKKLFVSGLTSSSLGEMEFHNLGNYIIAEPLFDQLRATFPEHEISTSLQMSDGFYAKYRITARRQVRFWTLDHPLTLLKSLIDLVRVILYKLTRSKVFLNTPLLSEIDSADIYIDFSGDVYGDNARATAFLEANVRLLLARLLGKKTAMIVGSPGPFASHWRQCIGKFVMRRVDLITNREPLSTAMLAYIGIKGGHIHSTACPSVFFEPEPVERLPKNADFERLFVNKKPTIGFILCGWNMPGSPYNKWPRDDAEFQTFIALIRYLLSVTDSRICVMSHQNVTDQQGNLLKGNDHKIIARLMELLGASCDRERVFTLEGVYTASQSKAIIGSFDYLISGRIHGAIQGLSQCIPTMIIDYGHEPKAHKLAGFARVYGMDDYVADPVDTEALKSCATRLLKYGSHIRVHLRDRLPMVKKLALSNLELLKHLSPM